jgi:quercetin dioxygenase-like cupin family protein
MQNFLKVADHVNVRPLLLALQRHPEIFGLHSQRRYAPGSPHPEMTDVWVRYNDCRPFEAGQRPWSEFNDEHESVWYPEADLIPEVRPVVFDLMAAVQGERLGGVLITKLAPGGKIAPHVDKGWHAEYYDKYYVALKSDPGAAFGFPDGVIEAVAGEVYWFRNDVPHWVINGSKDDRFAMIVCIRHSRGLAPFAPPAPREELPATDDVLAAEGVRIEHHFSGREYAKQTDMLAGTELRQHSHPHDHLSILAKGRVVVSVEGAQDKVVQAPHCLRIAAGMPHSVRALDDATWFCIHATGETDPSRVDATILEG